MDSKLKFILNMVTAEEERTVDWVDFKKAYPKLENNPAVKKLFGGRRKIPMSEVRERLPAIIKETQKKGTEFDAIDDVVLTYESWSGGQRSFGVIDIVLVANMGPRMIEELKEKLPNVYQHMVNEGVGGHPGGKHAFGWCRIAPLKGQAVVEEMQSDQLDALWSRGDDKTTEAVHQYFFKLVDWVGLLSKAAFRIAKNLANKSAETGNGEAFWIGPATVTRDHHVRSERKLNIYYNTVPKKLGLKGPSNYSLKNGRLIPDPQGKLSLWSETDSSKEQAQEEKTVKLPPKLVEKHAKYYTLLGAGGRRVSWDEVDEVWQEMEEAKRLTPAIKNEYKQLLNNYKNGIYESLVKEK